MCWDAFQDAVGIASYSVQAFEAPGGNVTLANDVTGVIDVGNVTEYTIIGLTLQACDLLRCPSAFCAINLHPFDMRCVS